MNILYIYAHPNSASFNNVLKNNALTILEKANHTITISDLYAQHFNATASWHDFDLPENELSSQYFMSQKIAYDKHALSPDIQTEIKKTKWAEHIIFQFPLWWFSVPGILKGWLDRVLVKGFAYDTGKVFADGLLKGKTASLVVSTQSSEAAYQINGLHGCTIDTFLHPIHHTLRFAGMEILAPFVTYEAFNIEATREVIILESFQNYLTNIPKTYHF